MLNEETEANIGRLPVSVVIPVRNEEKTVLKLLESLDLQTVKASEVIIVDGGSTDSTIDIVNSFIASHPCYKLLVAESANIARSRNIGISSASCDIIALTDSGVVLDKHWLENLVKRFDRADFVGGVYVGSGDSLLQQAIAILQYPKLDRLDEKKFLPSSRSVAFKRKVWKAVGGYPEWLEKAEDTFFDLKVKDSKFQVSIAKDAIVYWQPRSSLKQLFSQYLSYAEWDLRAGLLFRLKWYRLLFLAYFLVLLFLFLSLVFSPLWFLVLVFFVCAYLGASGVRVFLKTRCGPSFLVGPAIKIVIFMAETVGILKGIFRKMRRS